MIPKHPHAICSADMKLWNTRKNWLGNMRFAITNPLILDNKNNSLPATTLPLGRPTASSRNSLRRQAWKHRRKSICQGLRISFMEPEEQIPWTYGNFTVPIRLTIINMKSVNWYLWWLLDLFGCLTYSPSHQATSVFSRHPHQVENHPQQPAWLFDACPMKKTLHLARPEMARVIPVIILNWPHLMYNPIEITSCN